MIWYYFYCVLSQESIEDEKDSTLKLALTFRPYRPLEIWKEKLYVDVPNQDFPSFLYLYGHCFEYQVGLGGRGGRFLSSESEFLIFFPHFGKCVAVSMAWESGFPCNQRRD